MNPPPVKAGVGVFLLRNACLITSSVTLPLLQQNQPRARI